MSRGTNAICDGGAMKTMNQRRKEKRGGQLSTLAKSNPELFRYEWGKRLASWKKIASQRAKKPLAEAGAPTLGVFDLVDYAMNELKKCGEEAWNLEANDTIDDLIHFCCLAVSRVYDPRIYHVGNVWPARSLSLRGK
jgi:hypothetical protein